MYNKSKDRLRNLGETCLEVVKVISDVLEEELMSTDTSEDSSDEAEIIQILNNIQSQMSKVEKFVHGDSLEYQPAVKLPASTSKISADKRRQVLSAYHKVFQNMTDFDTQYVEVNECVNLLYRWFDIRFFESVKTNKTFKYNIRRIPKWTYDIIIVYSKCVANGTSDEFVAKFNRWLEDTYANKRESSYGVPYEVYKFDTSPKPEDLTLTACVIFDILIDIGLDTLCTGDELYLDSNQIYSMCETLNPEVLDHYENYSFNSDVISKSNIHSMKEGEA